MCFFVFFLTVCGRFHVVILILCCFLITFLYLSVASLCLFWSSCGSFGVFSFAVVMCLSIFHAYVLSLCMSLLSLFVSLWLVCVFLVIL